jgi:hypothetical protein
MGDWLIWLLLGSFIVILFCIYSLSSQVERCVHLAVEIITGNQRKILEQLETLAHSRTTMDTEPARNVVPFERRVSQRRRTSAEQPVSDGERRRSPGRRREDLLASRSS